MAETILTAGMYTAILVVAILAVIALIITLGSLTESDGWMIFPFSLIAFIILAWGFVILVLIMSDTNWKVVLT